MRALVRHFRPTVPFFLSTVQIAVASRRPLKPLIGLKQARNRRESRQIFANLQVPNEL